MSGTKNPTDQERLQTCEETIHRGMVHFVAMGNALKTIRDERLYRVVASTFKDYCQIRWGFTGQQGRDLIRLASISEELPEGSLKPARPYQLEALRGIENAAIRGVIWDKAVRDAGGKQPTKHQVNHVVGVVLGKPTAWVGQSQRFVRNLPSMADRLVYSYTEAEILQLVSLVTSRLEKKAAA